MDFTLEIGLRSMAFEFSDEFPENVNWDIDLEEI